MKNIIICADSIEYMAKIPDNSVDLIFADPPYWMRVEGVLKRPEGKDFNGCNDKWDSFSSDFEYNDYIGTEIDNYFMFSDNSRNQTHKQKNEKCDIIVKYY